LLFVLIHIKHLVNSWNYSKKRYGEKFS